jgi:cyclophilin family peptidyl-prolyl cis-trans isomerase
MDDLFRAGWKNQKFPWETHMKLLIIAITFVCSAFAWLNAYAANPYVEMKTNFGDITLELLPDKAPQTVQNFLRYVKEGYYKGTIFHRVINQFIIQGGGFTPDLEYKDTHKPIPSEAENGLTNEPGTIAMAREFDPNSATSQFFINLDSNKFLNHYKPQPEYYGYCVFGKVVKGMDVVEKIGAVHTAAAGPFKEDVPTAPVIIEDVQILDKFAENTPSSTAKSKKSKQKRHGKTSNKLRNNHPRT